MSSAIVISSFAKKKKKNAEETNKSLTYQQYQDKSVFCTILRVTNRSRTSPNLWSSSGILSSSSGMVVLLTFAIFLKISFASSIFPLTINQRTDSGVKLIERKRKHQTINKRSGFWNCIKTHRKSSALNKTRKVPQGNIKKEYFN